MHVFLIILAVIVFLAAFVLWSTVTFEIVSNGRKTVITASMWRFIKKEFVLPARSGAKKTPPKNDGKRAAKKEKSQKDSDAENPAIAAEKEELDVGQ